MLSPASRPRLARKARLRYDRKSERYLLLYPEKGLVLNPTAAEVLKLCTGEHRLDEIVARLAASHGGDAAVVEREVRDFLATMADRALVETAAEASPTSADGGERARPGERDPAAGGAPEGDP